MPGCARSNGITGELWLLTQAECNKVTPDPSTAMFTLKPGSCLIISATFFASPLLTAANMITERKREKKEEMDNPGLRLLAPPSEWEISCPT